MGQDSSPACTATSPSAPTDVTSPGQPPVSSWRSVDQGGPAPRAAIREVPTAGVLGMVRLCAGASASGRKLLVSSKPVCPKKEGRESSNMGERENLVSSCVLPPPYSSSPSSVPQFVIIGNLGHGRRTQQKASLVFPCRQPPSSTELSSRPTHYKYIHTARLRSTIRPVRVPPTRSVWLWRVLKRRVLAGSGRITFFGPDLPLVSSYFFLPNYS